MGASAIAVRQVAALEAWAEQLARLHPRVLAVARVNEHVRRTNADAAALWGIITDDWLAHCRWLMAWLDEEGRLASAWPVEAAADMLCGFMSFGGLESLLKDRGWSVEEYSARFATLLRSTFVA